MNKWFSKKKQTSKQTETQRKTTMADSQESMLRLSDDIGKMAEKIGVMADRIGTMADRILETQKIQSENVQLTQQSMLEVMKMMNDQFKANSKIMELLINKGINKDIL
jgi:hypothetical protein